MNKEGIAGKLGIVYIGSLDETSNSYRRFKSLEKLGHELTGIDIDPFVYRGIFTRFHHHLNIGPGIYKLNKKVVEVIKQKEPDLLWVDNKPFLTASTLKKIRTKCPKIKIIDLITDDATGKLRYAWRLCISTAKLYDCHFVQRSVNVPELKKVGARRVEMCYRSYDPAFHRPVKLGGEDFEKYHTSVGFIGTYESNREEYIAHLIENNVPVSITGNDWPNGKRWNIIKPFYKGPSVYGEAYIKSINGMDIALHFLRHGNRDEQDSRTFEIPACGSFMIAEKSALHLTLFEDGKEAVFFDTKEMLLEKVNQYLGKANERKEIAANGLERCRQSGYSHEERLKKVLKNIFEYK
ncbi:MAG: glycosyltransferase [Ferruginibacter sp.]